MKTSQKISSKIPSASHPITNDRLLDLITETISSDGRILDFGCGRGHMADRVAQWINASGQDARTQLTACDIDPKQFQSELVDCLEIAPDSSFPTRVNDLDLVYSIEVLEHLPRPYDFLANAYAALKPGGSIILSTPNLLHMTARLSFLLRGFPTMFAPPSAKPENAGRICGHIMPLSYGQIHTGLRKAGFSDITLHIDRKKRSAEALYFALWPLLKMGSASALARVKRIEPPLHEETGNAMRDLNGKILATSRSCVVAARKPV